MMQNPRLGRPPDRKNEIFASLLHRIVQGHYPPGSRLPTRREICKEFDASPATGQAALTDLARAGFTESRGKLGTFVQETPPHLHRHAVISFGSEHADTRIYTLLRNEAQRMKKEGWCLEIIDLPRPPLRDESLWPLEEQVRHHQFAGILFIRAPHHLMDSALVQEPGIPRVLLTDDVQSFPSYYASAPATLPAFFRAACREIKSLGKKRVGLFMHTQTHDQLQSARGVLTAGGLEISSAWAHTIHFSTPGESLPIVELLFQLPREKRPEIFLVSDDNLTEQVTLAIRNFAPPKDLPPVISLCNYPWLPPTHLPVRWLGYDLRELYINAIGLIENARRHIPNPHRLVRVPPSTEEELAAKRNALAS